jgi:CBS domain-containing protein
MDVFVGRLMSSPVRSVTPDAPVRNAAAKLIAHDIGSLVVVDDDNHLQGILTSTDFVRITADGASAGETTVEEYMTTDVITATANDAVRDVADTVVKQGFHHVPVVDDEEGVIGMITTTDLAAYLSQTEALAP